MITKKHFDAFAKEIKNQLENGIRGDAIGDKETCECMADLVCRIAKQFNPNFDEIRFRKACGLEKDYAVRPMFPPSACGLIELN